MIKDDISIHNGILPRPLGTGWLRSCMHCGKNRALILVDEQEGTEQGEIATYRCVHCNKNTVVAERHPPGAV